LIVYPVKIAVHQDDKLDWTELSYLEQENVRCDLVAKHLITSETRPSVPFPFALSSSYFLLESNIVLFSAADIYQYVSITHSKPYLYKKLHLTDIYQIDFSARFKAFTKFPKHLHLWASKSFCNFARIGKRMWQQGL